MKYINDPSIDRYLHDEMAVSERLDFETKMASDPELREAVEEASILVEGIRFAAKRDIRRRAEAARDHYRRTEWLRKMRPKIWTGGVLLVLAGLLLGYLIFSKNAIRQAEKIPIPVVIDSIVPSPEPRPLPTADTIPDQSKLIAKISSSKRKVNTSNPPLLVADPNHKGSYINSKIPAHRLQISGDQKTVVPLADIAVVATDSKVMRCVFYGDRILFSVPAKMAEGQPIEIIELRGASEGNGYYLRIGNRFFLLNTGGFVFDLAPTLKPKAID